MSDISATIKTVRETLRATYHLGPYQRDYEWEDRERDALVNDLARAFIPRTGEAGSKGYFLGTLLVKGSSELQLVDGQQRLTSLALMLAALYRLEREAQEERSAKPIFSRGPSAPQLDTLFREKFRQGALNQLVRDGRIATSENDLQRHLEIGFNSLKQSLADRLEPSARKQFTDWLLDKVTLVEIKAGQTHDPFALFDAMNSRGRPLQGMGQFKTFVSRLFGDSNPNREMQMQNFQSALEEISQQGAGSESDFVKSWLAARCLEVVEPTPVQPAEAKRKLQRSPMSEIESTGPFFAIGHKTLHSQLGFDNPSEFVESHWCKFAESFVALRQARTIADPDLAGMYFLQMTRFDFGLFDEVLMLAAVRPGQDDPARRMRIALQFMENIAARLSWTSGEKTLAARKPDRVKYLLAHAATSIRTLRTEKELADRLALIQQQLKVEFHMAKQVLHPKTGVSEEVHALLARLTGFLERLDSGEDAFLRYARRGGSQSFEIEHLLPRLPGNKGVANGHQFTNEQYKTNRQRLGALILLPSQENKRLSATPYPKKRSDGEYRSNPLAQSLFGNTALRPKIRTWLDQQAIVFPDLTVIDMAGLKLRETALLKLAEQVWSPERLYDTARP